MRLVKLALPPLAALCAAVLFVTAEAADNWPRFRGPNGTGVAPDKDIPVQWTAADVLWKIGLPGHGNSSPIVWDDKIFVQSASLDGKERLLLCLSLADGKTLWSKSLSGNRAGTHKKNTLASSTPAADGERVYALFWDGTAISLHAFDFKGNPLWEYNLGSFRSQHGNGASPVVYDGKVFVNNDQDGRAELVAVDAKTGTLAWKAKRDPERTCYSTPFLREKADGGSELVVASTGGLTGYDPKTGAVNWNWVWHFTGKRLRTVGSPITTGGLVLAQSGDGDGSRHTVTVKLGGKGDLGREALAWESTRGSGAYVPCLLASGEYLYRINDKGQAACLVAATGKEVWSESLGGDTSASPVLIDGKVYALTESGDVYVFRAAPKFELLGKSTMGETVIATPAVSQGRLLIRGSEHLFCIGKK
jgi:outer membrane protein assembly factor BamB